MKKREILGSTNEMTRNNTCMGDSFFKVFFISCFVILFLAGAIMLMQMEQETSDRKAISAYMNSRGKTPLPRSWRSERGKGI